MTGYIEICIFLSVMFTVMLIISYIIEKIQKAKKRKLEEKIKLNESAKNWWDKEGSVMYETKRSNE